MFAKQSTKNADESGSSNNPLRPSSTRRRSIQWQTQPESLSISLGDYKRVIDNEYHISNSEVQKLKYENYFAIRSTWHTANKLYITLSYNDEIKRLIDNAGWAKTFSVHMPKSNRGIVEACIRRWWDTTHTFHLPTCEIGLTPFDFIMITDIRSMIVFPNNLENGEKSFATLDFVDIFGLATPEFDNYKAHVVDQTLLTNRGIIIGAEHVCKTTTDQSLCVSALRSDPHSASEDMKRLAHIMFKVSLSKGKDYFAQVKKLLGTTTDKDRGDVGIYGFHQQWTTDINNAILENYGCLLEDEIYCAINFTFSKELNAFFNRKSILITYEVASKEGNVLDQDRSRIRVPYLNSLFDSQIIVLDRRSYCCPLPLTLPRLEWLNTKVLGFRVFLSLLVEDRVRSTKLWQKYDQCANGSGLSAKEYINSWCKDLPNGFNEKSSLWAIINIKLKNIRVDHGLNVGLSALEFKIPQPLKGNNEGCLSPQWVARKPKLDKARYS
ncbi:hypothetical protein LguiB_012446 [Lonicera macranthoides]